MSPGRPAQFHPAGETERAGTLSDDVVETLVYWLYPGCRFLVLIIGPMNLRRQAAWQQGALSYGKLGR